MNSRSLKKFFARFQGALHLDALSPGVRRTVIGIIGGTVLVIGVALIVLPGPAFIVIPVGLAILATEFAWARRYLVKARALLAKAKDKSTAKKHAA
jgi:uncharacterized protein (TIGR02611 family)